MSKTTERLQELIELKYDIVVDLYRQRARFLEARSKGQEPTLVKWLGPDLIGSIACLIDPYWQLVQVGKIKGKKSSLISTLFPVTPVPVNRTRYFDSIVPCVPYYKEYARSTQCSKNFLGSYGCAPPTVSDTSNTLIAQGRVQGWVKDTTWKSRNPGSKISHRSNKYGLQSQGEFELFRPYYKADGITYGWRNKYTDSQVISGGNLSISRTTSYVHGYFSTPNSSVDSSQVKLWPVNERIYAVGVMAKNLDSMLARCVPNRRYYNLFYQLGELKDLPGTVKTTLAHWRDLERLLGKNSYVNALLSPKWWTKSRVKSIAPQLERVGIARPLDQTLSDLYLNFKFGWQSMYQAATKLVDKPGRITKEVNYLIRRNGKFTKLSTSKSWTEPVASFPAFNIVIATSRLQWDSANPPSFSATRDIKLRCMCDVGINFPPISEPVLRKRLFLEKLGVVPTPGDLYDLIPWTWMIDWFVGLGDYIHVMDRVNGQAHLINYGFMSYKSTTRIRATWQYKTFAQDDLTFTPPGGTHTYVVNGVVKMSSMLVLEYELRLGLDKLASVKSYAGIGLSQDQRAILSALFSKFGK